MEPLSPLALACLRVATTICDALAVPGGYQLRGYESGQTILIEIDPGADYAGAIIGKQGRYALALRTILQACGHGQRHVEVHIGRYGTTP